MGTRDLTLRRFRLAGQALARLGLVTASEGNLSTLDGSRLVITRTGAQLGALTEEDVLEGTLHAPPPGASSDLDRHRWIYEEEEGRAVVHAHPPGSMPEGWREGQPHGIYAHGPTLEHALATAVSQGKGGASAPSPDHPQSSTTFRPVWLEAGRFPSSPHGGLFMLDQSALPADPPVLACASPDDVADAIRRMAVRGAPVLGITAALGVALATVQAVERGEDPREAAEKAGALLIGTRPTAVNIQWAVDRVKAAGKSAATDTDYAEAVVREAGRIEIDDAEACSAMGWFGEALVPEGANVLTHCNTGMLCTAGIGTAFGVIWCAHVAGNGIHVWVDETRPALQGARLTVWELQRLGIPHTLIADGAAASLMAAGRIDVVIVGADRIAANGDVANKVGTYPLAVLANEHGVPFYVAAPTSTVDLATPTGGDIPIEERDPAEVTAPRGVPFAPPGAAAFNPAFDMTPSRLITGIVTERGLAEAPYQSSLAPLLERSEPRP